MVLLKDGLELELLRKSSPLASDGKDTVILKNERRSVTFCCTVNVHTVNYQTIHIRTTKGGFEFHYILPSTYLRSIESP